MAYGKRKAPGNNRPFGFTKKRKFTKRRTFSAPSRSLSTKNSVDRCFVKCTKIETKSGQQIQVGGVSGSSPTIFGNMKMSELAQNSKFLRFASMYSYFRVHKMKTTFNTTGSILTAVTSFDPDDDGVPTTLSHITQSLNSRFHDIRDGKVTSRSVSLAPLDKWSTFISTQGAQSALGSNRYKSTIQYAFPGVLDASVTAHIHEEWIVEFRNLRDAIAVNAINPAGPALQGAALGPDQIPDSAMNGHPDL